jgi:hypothetical protein
MDLDSTLQPAGGSPALTVSLRAAGGLPTSADVAMMVAATSVNKRAGTVTSQDVRLEIERTQKCALHSYIENPGNFRAFK